MRIFSTYCLEIIIETIHFVYYSNCIYTKQIVKNKLASYFEFLIQNVKVGYGDFFLHFLELCSSQGQVYLQ